MSIQTFKKVSVWVVFICICAIPVFAKGDPKLLGTWQCRTPGGTVNLIFKSDTLLVFDGDQARYSVNQNIIRVTDEDGIADYPYSFKGKTLVITFPEGYQLQFVKTGPAPKQSKPVVQGKGSVSSSELARQIAGVWWGYSGSTERKIGLCPGGAYQDYTESSYSGKSHDSVGNESMNWGTGSQNSGIGTWQISGNYNQGVITVRYRNGSQKTMQYRQCGETGCLLFDGNKLCRNGKCR